MNMAFDRRMRAVFLSCVIIIFGIIHFGVGVGIARTYHKYHDIFEQQVGLSGFNIFIGFFTMIIGIIGIISLLKRNALLSKITSIAAFFFGIVAFASLVTALVLSGQAATHFRNSITYNMNDYIQDQSAIDIINTLQTNYQCCGVNLWLDWSRVQLGAGNGISNGRRRRDEDSSSFLTRLTQIFTRRKRQVVTPGTIYNLPSSYTFYLPPSCCIGGSGTSSSGNSLGGNCLYNSGSSSSSFYVSGCLEPVCNTGFSQIAGYAFINTCLTILMFVYFGKMIKMFPGWGNSNNEQSNQNGTYQGQQQQQQQQQQYQYPYEQNSNYNKQPYQNGMYQGQQQQYPYEQYYVDNNNSNPYYIYNSPTYQTYH